MSSTYTVGNYSTLNAAIDTIDDAVSGNYTIQITNDITLTSDLDAISLHDGVTLTIEGSDGAGGDYTLDGGSQYRGLLVYSGDVTISNLGIADAAALGGTGADGDGGGGGGAGLGGGLLVAQYGTVTLESVNFSGDSATGGNGGAGNNAGGGGGGGLGGNGGVPSSRTNIADDPIGGGGGGGGVGSQASGGEGGAGGSDGRGGIVPGAPAGGQGADGGGVGGSSGGGGGGGNDGDESGWGAGGGGIGGTSSSSDGGGTGGWGGGGGGAGANVGHLGAGGNGGFGGGGGGGQGGGGTSMFGGGGGGGGADGSGGQSGFGAGNGTAGGAGGGGLGAGGDIFVQQGGSLIIAGGSLGAGIVKGGIGAGSAQNGEALGSSVFIQGSQTLTLSEEAGQTLTVGGTIADQDGLGAIAISGPGIVILDATNSYSGGTTVDAGATVEAGAAGAFGSGSLALTGSDITLQLDAPSGFTNDISGFNGGDHLDLRGLAFTAGESASYSDDTLTLTGGGAAESFSIASSAAFLNGIAVSLSSDGAGGTAVVFDTTLFLVGNAEELDTAIASVDSATSGNYTIQFTSDISETSDPYAFNLASGVSVTVDGMDDALDGGGAHRGLFVYAGAVTISDLTIQDATARGGAGGLANADNGAGGGGAGLGGGLFIGEHASVTLMNVSFSQDEAIGGSGGGGSTTGSGSSGGSGGGGGLGGNGAGGGGGVGTSASGGSAYDLPGSGIIIGAAPGGGLKGSSGGTTPGGANGGGGAAADPPIVGPNGTYGTGGGGSAGGGGGVDGKPMVVEKSESATRGVGGDGGFGGGGGVGYTAVSTGAGGGESRSFLFPTKGGKGGFGGGGGGGGSADEVSALNAAGGGNGGFGGGGGGGGAGLADLNGSGGAGGFGAGNGVSFGAGGGGLGAGGDIFVQQGGALIIEGGVLNNGTVVAGAAGITYAVHQNRSAQAGQAFGGGLFLQGNESVAFAAAAGQTTVTAGVIADQSGSGGTGGVIIGTAGGGGLTGIVELDAVNSYTGGTDIESGRLMLGTAGAAGSGAITFGSGDPPSLAFTLAAAPTNTIDDFAAGDIIDITDMSFVAPQTLTLGADGILTVTEGAETVSLTFSAAAGDVFTISSDGGSGTQITLCFYPGTRIATVDGEIAVQDLREGMEVVTADGRALPVRWLGRSDVSLHFADKLRMLPIRICAGALDEGLPRRDLLVSPCHAMFIDGVLIQAGALVNGLTIRREYSVPDCFSYYHVELETHELLLAEGAATESFVDNVDRMNFSNWGERTVPDKPIAELPYPRAQSHRQVPIAIRRILAQRAKLLVARLVA